MEMLIPVVIVLVVAGIIYSFYISAKRRKELAAWAHSKALRFDRAKNHGMDGRFGEFKCLCRGHSRYAYNVMTGDWSGLPITAFDYHYTTGSGKNRSEHHFSAAIVKAPIPLKPLYIRREHFFDKLTEFFGYDDIDFESAEFSRRFYVKSRDKRWAYDVIHQRMMDYLLSAPEFAVQFDFGHVIAWRSRRFKTTDFEVAIEHVRAILDQLPEYVVRQQTS